MSAPLRPITARGLVSVWLAPLEGPDMIWRTTFAFAGRHSPGSAGCKCKFELVASARAKDGRGDMTTVESTRRLTSTIVVLPHFEHLNCTFECPPNSPSFSRCSVPQ